MVAQPDDNAQLFKQPVGTALVRPVPVMDKLRELKQGYRELSIDRNHPKFNEPVVDITLRFKQATSGYVEGGAVPMGREDGDTAQTINPDYFEQFMPKAQKEAAIQRNRRAYYAIMTGAAFAVDTGFVCNPTEWWHWGRGDQLSEKVRGHASAYYSLAQPIN